MQVYVPHKLRYAKNYKVSLMVFPSSQKMLHNNNNILLSAMSRLLEKIGFLERMRCTRTFALKAKHSR
jgi:hypothetical protein